MRVLVCGGRDADEALVRDWLLRNSSSDWNVIIHGCSRGADSAAGVWAFSVGLDIEEYPADWDTYGKRAGPVRNQRMLIEGRPDIVVAFPGGRGTADMVKRAEKAKIKVIRANI